MHSEEQEITIPADVSPKERSQLLKAGMHKTSKENALNSQVGQYLFWGATSLLALAIGGPLLDPTNFAAAAGQFGISSTALGLGMGGLSAAALAGSVRYSEKAADSSENNDLLYSKKQAMDIARAISYEHAADPVVIAVPAMVDQPQRVRPDGKTWVDAAASDRKPAMPAASWAEQVAASQNAPQGEITL